MKNKKFAERCRELRIQNGKSVSYMRRHSEFGEKYRKWEEDGIVPSASSLFSLAEFFNVSPYYLLGISDSPCVYDSLSDDELEIIQKYRNLSEEKRKLLSECASDLESENLKKDCETRLKSIKKNKNRDSCQKNEIKSKKCEQKKEEKKERKEEVMKMTIKEARRKQRITRDALVRTLGLDPREYSLIEDLQLVPDRYTAELICNYLNTKVCNIRWK